MCFSVPAQSGIPLATSRIRMLSPPLVTIALGSRTRPPVGADLDPGKVPGEAGVERARLPVVPQTEVRKHGRVDAEAVARRVEGGKRPITPPVPARAAPVLLPKVGLTQDLSTARIVHPRTHLHVRRIEEVHEVLEPVPHPVTQSQVRPPVPDRVDEPAAVVAGDELPPGGAA